MDELHGLYAYTRRDGLVLLVQYEEGRPVEVMSTRSLHRPKRLTRRRLGDSITEWLEQERVRRLHAAIRALTPEGWEGPQSPQMLARIYRRTKRTRPATRGVGSP
jgi:hypothetical protein